MESYTQRKLNSTTSTNALVSTQSNPKNFLTNYQSKSKTPSEHAIKIVNQAMNKAFITYSTDSIKELFAHNDEEAALYSNQELIAQLHAHLNTKKKIVQTLKKRTYITLGASTILSYWSLVPTECQEDVRLYCDERKFYRSFRGNKFCESMEKLHCGDNPWHKELAGIFGPSILATAIIYFFNLRKIENLISTIENIINENEIKIITTKS
jgi:hypothetical protein